ncbi:MAG TPA: endonuclease/exonuclease/phosphatase family protein [Nonomuraea sp.]|nr:endonuclease/exonuclease/phosphatase family protein [Nonomuraea sp.]
MTLNIWNLSGPWRERREEIVAWLARLEPDVVCLQEVIEAADGRNQAAWLAAAPALSSLGYHHAYGRGLELEGGRWFGNAVLSREEIETTNAVPLPALDAPTEGRVLLHARTGGTDVFCTHLNWQYHHGYIREAQVRAAVEAIEQLADPGSAMPPILAGDFNAEPVSTEIRFLTGDASLAGRSTYHQDAWRVAGGREPGWTWDNRDPFANAVSEPDRRIDYVFVGWRRESGAGRVEAARVVCDRALTGTFASDHFGVVADIADASS